MVVDGKSVNSQFSPICVTNAKVKQDFQVSYDKESFLGKQNVNAIRPKLFSSQDERHDK